MSKIRLHGSSSGYTEIAPVAASGNNTLTLPNDGTIISKDANGAVGVTSITVGTGVTIGDGKITCDGSALTSINAANLVGVCTSGLTKTGGFGKILQVVSASKTSAVSSNSTTYYSIGLNATITPSSTSSKILVLMDLAYGGMQNMYGYGKIVRTPSGGSATDIALGDDRTGSYSNSQQVSFSLTTINNANVVYKLHHATVNFLDSPSTTAATTYAVQAKSVYGGGDGYFYINTPATTDNQPYHVSASSNLTLIEIAA